MMMQRKMENLLWGWRCGMGDGDSVQFSCVVMVILFGLMNARTTDLLKPNANLYAETLKVKKVEHCASQITFI
jgi:hypothetical protein